MNEETIDLPVLAYDAGYGVQIELVRQNNGSTRWAVRHRGLCLNSDGKWQWEPMQGSRDSSVIARCRYASAGAALAALLERRRRDAAGLSC